MRFAFFLFILMLAFSLDAAEFPKPTGFIYDGGGLLSVEDEKEVSGFLSDFERKTSNEIVVVIVPNLDGLPIGDYSVKLFEAWGIGKKGRDNGALLLIAVEERQFRIEVGYGLEGDLTDSESDSILRKIAPFFQDRKFKDGIMLALNEISSQLSSDYALAASKRSSEDKASFLVIFVFILVVILLLVFAAAVSQSFKNVLALGSYVIIAGTWAFQFLGILGVVAVVVIAFVLIFLSSKGNFGSGGFGPHGGFKGGGFSGGGGFGGFGGGMSGGGGASGRW